MEELQSVKESGNSEDQGVDGCSHGSRIAGNFMAGRTTVSFARRTILPGIN